MRQIKRAVPYALAAAYVAVLALICIVPPARSSTQTLEAYRTAIHNQHDWTNRALANRCRPRVSLDEFTKTPLAVVRPAWRDDHVKYATNRHHRAQAKSSLCIPTTPTGIIRYVFPAASEDLAIRVASCETVGFTDYYNESSGASGLFQLMPFHWQGNFDPFNMLANARYALQLSHNGTSFSGPWAASAGCWS